MYHNKTNGVDCGTWCTVMQRNVVNLHQWIFEWASNSPEFRQNIPECDWTNAETMKVLGTSWNSTTDTIFINGSHNLSSEVTTKQKQCCLSAEFTTHWVSFPQPHWIQSCSFRNCRNKKEIGMTHSVSHINKNGTRYSRAWLHNPLGH